MYQVSNLGRVKSLDRKIKRKDGVITPKEGKILTQHKNQDGYYQLKLSKNGKSRTLRVHRLIAETFIPNPDNLDTVNHIDFNRTNNKIDNLEWLSHRDNITHSVNAGRYDGLTQGEGNGRAILSKEDVINIRKLYRQGAPKYKIAEKYNRGWSTIHNIIENHTWKHIA